MSWRHTLSLIAASSLLVGTLAGCGDDDPAAGCTDGAKLDCTLPDGSQGHKVCQGGQWTACSPIAGACTDGTFKECTTADNKEGTQKCVDGQWSECKANEIPACTDGDTQACSSECGTGQEVCVNGEWKNCDAPKPQQEVCDGVDNNCDGKIDEVCSCVHGETQECYTGPAATKNVGVCKAGTKTCDKGTWGTCQNEVLPDATESCTDKLDNDCNGTVNDGCTCTAGDQQPCGTDVGECSKGTQTCTQAAEWGECLGGVAAQPEKDFGCDGKDNDCDGVIDNGLDPDADEKNDTCALSRHYTIKDSDKQAKELTLTIYPQGDIDYFQITADENVNDICWFGDPECNWLDVEIIPPATGSVDYDFDLMVDDCSSPTDTFKDQTKLTVEWDGKCFFSDNRDFYIKVSPTQSSSPSFTCEPYTLKLRYTSKSEACTPATP